MEQVALQGGVLQLLEAVKQEKELRLESVGLLVLVELFKERVFLEIFLDEHRIPALGDNLGKGSLPHADSAFDGQKMNALFSQHIRVPPRLRRGTESFLLFATGQIADP